VLRGVAYGWRRTGAFLDQTALDPVLERRVDGVRSARELPEQNSPLDPSLGTRVQPDQDLELLVRPHLLAEELSDRAR
jgi:hypothetical protein